MNFEEIESEVKEIHFGLGIKSEEFEKITVADKSALKNIFDSVALGPGIVVYVPIENKLHNFILNWNSNDKDRCIQEFDRFLETVSFR